MQNYSCRLSFEIFSGPGEQLGTAGPGERLGTAGPGEQYFSLVKLQVQVKF